MDKKAKKLQFSCLSELIRFRETELCEEHLWETCVRTYLDDDAIACKNCCQHGIEYVVKRVIPWDNRSDHTKRKVLDFGRLVKHHLSTRPASRGGECCMKFIFSTCYQPKEDGA